MRVYHSTPPSLASEPMKRQIIVAIDIEKAGPLPTSKIVSIGVTYGPLEEKVELKTLKINVQARWPKPTEDSSLDFNAQTWKQFWKRFPDAISAAMTNPDPVMGWEAANLFSGLIYRLEEEYPAKDWDIRFVSDNPSFDISSLDYMLDKEIHQPPMRYTRHGPEPEYRDVYCVDTLLMQFPKPLRDSIKTQAVSAAGPGQPHDAAWDARLIWWQYFYASREIQSKFIQPEEEEEGEPGDETMMAV